MHKNSETFVAAVKAKFESETYDLRLRIYPIWMRELIIAKAEEIRKAKANALAESTE